MLLRSRAARLALTGLTVMAVGLATTPALAAGSTTLQDRAELTRTAGGKDKYDLDLPGSYWAAVAVRPKAGVTADLKLFAEPSRETVLARSGKKGTAIDFVALDAGSFPASSYYPNVTSGGGGDYVIELDKGSLQLLSWGDEVTFSMGSNDVVRTVSIVAQHFSSEQYQVTLTPSDGDQDGAIYVMRDVYNLEDPYLGRKEAEASVNAKGPGGTEKVTFMGGFAEDEFGIVITNLSGSGTYTVKVTKIS